MTGALAGFHCIASPSAARTCHRNCSNPFAITPDGAALRCIDAVSYDDVASTAARFLRDKGHAQAAHGSLGNLRPFEACHVSNFN